MLEPFEREGVLCEKCSVAWATWAQCNEDENTMTILTDRDYLCDDCIEGE